SPLDHAPILRQSAEDSRALLLELFGKYDVVLANRESLVLRYGSHPQTNVGHRASQGTGQVAEVIGDETLACQSPSVQQVAVSSRNAYYILQVAIDAHEFRQPRGAAVKIDQMNWRYHSGGGSVLIRRGRRAAPGGYEFSDDRSAGLEGFV